MNNERIMNKIQLQQENWDKLKECIKFNRKISLSLDNKYGVHLCDTLLSEMQELERGDSNE